MCLLSAPLTILHSLGVLCQLISSVCLLHPHSRAVSTGSSAGQPGRNEEPAGRVGSASLGACREGSGGLRNGSLKARGKCGSFLGPPWRVWTDRRCTAECAAWALGGGAALLKVESLLPRPLRHSMASQAELRPKQTALEAVLLLKIDPKVVPHICLEQTRGLRLDNLSSVDTPLFQHQISQVVKGD